MKVCCLQLLTDNRSESIHVFSDMVFALFFLVCLFLHIDDSTRAKSPRSQLVGLPHLNLHDSY